MGLMQWYMLEFNFLDTPHCLLDTMVTGHRSPHININLSDRGDVACLIPQYLAIHAILSVLLFNSSQPESNMSAQHRSTHSFWVAV